MSLTPAQCSMIATEVNTWMDAERMFTAFEISRALKAKGIGLRHRDMKRQVHTAISARRSRSYTRTLMDVGAPEQAWVYHPMSKNPYQFRALARSDGKPAAPSTTNTPPATRPTAPNTATPGKSTNTFKPRKQVSLADNDSPQTGASDGTYGCDSNGHLKLQASELQKIGVAANQEVMISGDPRTNKVVVGLAAHVDDDGAEPAQTLDNGDLIVDHEILEFADLDWLACYKVECANNRLEISE